MEKQQFNKVLQFFTVLWFFTIIGLLIGTILPQAFILPLSIVTLILLIAMMFSRTMRRLGRFISIIVAILVGITFYSALNFYLGALGGGMVLLILGTTAIIFIAAGLYGYYTKRDFTNKGSILFILLVGLIAFSIIAIFVKFSSVVWIFVSALGVIVFTVYTIFDMNRIAKQPIKDEDVPMIALNLYLDFINLFQYLLSLVYNIRRTF
ncbi:Bax inhibitor-1 family protein [Kurthia sp. YJT4]|uniref:Bax inhibitor-1/YccA family protein n=1 Tax=Kurthia sp. YJT4 TaxID=3049086 RepID=UPI00254EB57D|nr:Bax inhibitor-1 family protein [Kurthia sp. YJT4]WIL37844.1 Bax inhibitor-1 family protein [Kurthia sp. YJT4]